MSDRRFYVIVTREATFGDLSKGCHYAPVNNRGMLVPELDSLCIRYNLRKSIKIARKYISNRKGVGIDYQVHEAFLDQRAGWKLGPELWPNPNVVESIASLA